MNAHTNCRTVLQELKHKIEVLERFELQLRKALKFGGDTETFEQVCARVLSGNLIMHALPNAVVLCELSKYGGGVAYHTYLIAGNLDDVIKFQRGPIQDFAKAAGCNILSGSGRPGWKKPLLAEGWKIIRYNFVKEL